MRPYEPSMSDEAVARKTGRDWSAWFAMLDEEGADQWSHREIAAWLQEAHGLSGWWAQSVTVEYERARGLRDVGQVSEGDFAVSAQRTVAAPVDLVMDHWLESARRDAWLTDELLAPAVAVGMRAPRTSQTAMGDVVRCGLRPDGAPNEQRLEVTFSDEGDRTVVRVTHRGIHSKDERDALKARWGPELDRFKMAVESAKPVR